MSRYGTNPHSSMQHLNGNLLCAVDVETTGVVPGHHELWQIAVLPLDSNIKPLKTIMPFYVSTRLKRPENIDPKAIKVSKPDFVQMQLSALDPWKAVDLFEEWFTRLNLPVGKKIMPLASNWVFDRAFVMDWLGDQNFDFHFHFHYRDTQAVALFMNDRADQHCERVPYPKVGLPYLGSLFKARNEKAHDALQDCIQSAEVYRGLCHAWTPVLPGASFVEPPDINTN